MNEQVIRVLLIDDDEDDFVITRELFSLIKEGRYLLDWAPSYEDGLKLAKRREHDVCLVDFSLGAFNGVDLIREAREARVTTPMILLTGSGSYQMDLDAMHAGATDYLIKNETSPSRIERTVRYAVQLNIERSRTEAELVSFAEEQAALTEIGRIALVGGEIKDLFAEVTGIVARTLGVEYSKLTELTQLGDSLVLRGGVGWQDNHTLDETRVSPGRESQAGFTLLGNQTVVVEDLSNETRFRDKLLVEHGIRSGISVVIHGPNSPFGVLGAHTTSLRKFSDHDINFIVTVANIMAEAIARRHAEDELRTSEARFRRVIESNVFGIFFSDPSGEISFANDAFLEMVGYDRSDLMAGRVDWAVMSPPEYADADATAMVQIISQGACETCEKEFLRKDGSRVAILISVATFEGTEQGGVAFVLDISDRKRAEESLQQSQAWLDAIFDASRDGIVVEENDHVVYANKALANLYGYGSQEEMIGKHVSAFRTPDENQRLLDFARQRIAGEDAPTVYEFKGIRKDSSLFDAEVSVSSFQSDGKTFIVSTLRDITKRSLAESALRESDEKFHQLADNITDAFWIRSSDMRELHYVSPAFERIWGRSVESLYANPHLWSAFIVPEDRDRVRAAFAELKNGLPILDVEYRIVRPEGEIRWVRVRGFPVRDDANRIIRHTGIVTDITERKQTQDALRNSMEEFRILTEAMPQMVWITRADGWNIYFSQQWTDYTGLTLEESFGRGWNKPFHPEDQQRARDAWELAATTGGIYSIECRLRRADGVYRWWLVRGVPFRGADGSIVKWFGTCTDIHDLKLAEQEVLRANESLRESEERYRELVENAIDIIYTLDRDGNYTSVWIKNSLANALRQAPGGMLG